jgi:hypothetical protein
LKKDVEFIWTEEQVQSFNTLKQSLYTQPLLQYPDFSKLFVITTDASGFAIGGILSQGTMGKDLPIAYTSRLLNQTEKNYSTIKKELLAIVYSVHYFRSYVYGRKFLLVTDHRPLTWLHSVKNPISRLVRWRLKLAKYEYEVLYKAGKMNVNADALSRNSVDEYKISLINEESTDNKTDDEIFDAPSRFQTRNIYTPSMENDNESNGINRESYEKKESDNEQNESETMNDSEDNDTNYKTARENQSLEEKIIYT